MAVDRHIRHAAANHSQMSCAADVFCILTEALVFINR
jgi:hypothetical protein